MGRHRSRFLGRGETPGKPRGRVAQTLPTRRLRLEVLEARRLLSLAGVPPAGGLEWIAAATDEPAEAGTPPEIAFSGEAGILTAAPAAPDLVDISDTGVLNTDNLTNLDSSTPEKSLKFAVGNTIVGATVTLYADGVAIGSAVGTSATTTITTNDSVDLVDGPHAITARQTAPGEEESPDSAALAVTIDTVAPVVNPVRLGAYDTGGLAYGVAVSGSLAYVADGTAGLQIIDVANPAAPVRLGNCNTGGYAYDVAVSGTLAYVAAYDAGLQIIDVTNPAAPVLLGGYDTIGKTYGVAVAGSLAYVADFNVGLVVLDVSSPAAPMWLGGYDTDGLAEDVAVVGSLAYVADYSAGLVIVDVSNPAAPVRLGGCDTSGSAFGVAVAGSVAYVADLNAGLVIIDVSNSATPVRLGEYDTSGNAWGVAVSGTVAYVADSTAGLQIVDVADPAVPVRLGALDTSGLTYDVTISGRLAYVADCDAGLVILDLAPPASPPAPDLQSASDTGVSNTDDVTADNTPTFDLAVPVGAYFRMYRDGVQISGDYESGVSYTTAIQAAGRYGYSFTTLDAAGNVAVPSWALSVMVDPRILSIPELEAVFDTGVSSADDLTNLDNSGPDKTLKFAVDRTVAGATITLYADGTAIGSAVADGTKTIVATNGSFDLADGAHAITARQTLPGEAESPDSAALTVTIDTVAPDPLFSRRLGGYDTFGYAREVVVSGSLAYLAAGDDGVVILDVSNPARPMRFGGDDTSGEACGVLVTGPLAYVADRQAGLQIIDVSNPAAPVRLGGFDTSGFALSVAVSDTLAYVADWDAGLQIIDVTKPAAPVRLGGYDTRCPFRKSVNSNKRPGQERRFGVIGMALFGFPLVLSQGCAP
ncbi:MAG: Ig-like domain-containing protein, partial [Pirellulales bacterium]